MLFTELNIKKEIKEALVDLKFETLTPIQEKTINFNLEQPQTDIIAQAQTGTGKTAAFAIPILNNIDENLKQIQALIISPTRELTTQIFKQINSLAVKTNIRASLILGGTSYERQFKELSKKPQIIVATPGRLNDLVKSKKVDLSKIEYFTLDEADELLKIGFKKEIEEIIDFLPKKRTNFFFTATFDKKTKELAKKMTSNPETLSVSQGIESSNSINQFFLITREKYKLNDLITFLRFYEPKSMIIFGRTKNRVEELNNALNESGFKTFAIQGNMQQSDRNIVMKRFREKEEGILIATDVVARGIDISHVDWVLNFDMPQEIEYYTHRIGRVGRAGRVGNSLSFVNQDEIEHLNLIKEKTNSTIKKMILPDAVEINKKWIERLKKKHQDILLEEIDQQQPNHLENDLLAKYKKDDLIRLLSHYIFDTRNKKINIKLRPEPSVSLKGAARVRNFRRGNNRGFSRDNSRRNRNFNTPRKSNYSKKIKANGRSANFYDKNKKKSKMLDK